MFNRSALKFTLNTSLIGLLGVTAAHTARTALSFTYSYLSSGDSLPFTYETPLANPFSAQDQSIRLSKARNPISSALQPTAANPFTIDTFSEVTGADQFVQVTGLNPMPPSDFSQQGNFSTVVGGYRDIFLTNAIGTTNRRAASAVIEPSVSQTLFYNNDTNVSSRLEVTWDGNDNSSTVDTNGLGGIDITQNDKLDAISVLFASADQSEAVIINIWDINGGFSTASFTFPNLILDERVNFFYDLAEFTAATGNKSLFSGGVDFTQVGAIQLQLRGDPQTLTALDAEVDIVESVDIIAEIPDSNSLFSSSGFALLLMVRKGIQWRKQRLKLKS